MPQKAIITEAANGTCFTVQHKELPLIFIKPELAINCWYLHQGELKKTLP
jgi:hypothetical protein